MISYLRQVQFYFRIIKSSFLQQSKDRTVNNFFIASLLIQPIIMTLLSVNLYNYGNQPQLSILATIGAGMIGIWNSNLWTTGRIIEEERKGGTLLILLASPNRLITILIGKSLSNSVVSILSMGISLGTGLLIFRIPVGITNPLHFFLGILLTVIALTNMGLVLGSIFVLTRNGGQYTQAFNFPIFILSGLMFPITFLPSWLRPFSNLLATTWGNKILIEAVEPISKQVWVDYVWLTGLSILYFSIAYFLFNKLEFLARQSGSIEVW